MKDVFNKNKSTFMIAVGSFLFARTASAQGNLNNALPNLGSSGNAAGTTGAANLGEMVGKVISVGLSLVGLIFLILMVYAGYLWMTARGNDEQVSKARSIIVGSLIGMVIVVSAYAITYLVGANLQ